MKIFLFILVLFLWSCKPKVVELPSCYSIESMKQFLLNSNVNYWDILGNNQSFSIDYQLKILKNGQPFNLGGIDSLSFLKYLGDNRGYDTIIIPVYQYSLPITNQNVFSYFIIINTLKYKNIAIEQTYNSNGNNYLEYYSNYKYLNNFYNVNDVRFNQLGYDFRMNFEISNFNIAPKKNGILIFYFWSNNENFKSFGIRLNTDEFITNQCYNELSKSIDNF